MGRRARDNRPHLKPVERIQLSGEHMTLRLIAAAVFLLLGAAALTYAFTRLLSPETGWQTIEAGASEGANCGDEFVFFYELGAAGASVSAESKAVSRLYTDACRRMYQIFHTLESFEGMTNLREVNLHPNETLTVDEVLYRAFETVQRRGDRTIYLGPVYERYGGLFRCTDDSQLPDFDPYLSEEVRKEYEAAAAFANDPRAVELRLLGDNQVCLYVSEEYLAYARQWEIERYLDFGWLKNAFVIDYLAQVLTENGYTHGSISSYDGFVRSLDDRGLNYALNLYDFADGAVYPAGVMNYQGPRSMVYLRDYPLSEGDGRRMYRLETGEVRTSYLSPGDGRCKSAVHDLIVYSDRLGCAEIALQAAPIYVTDTLNVSALERLADSGTQSVRFENRVIRGTDPGLTLTDLYEGEGVRYTVSLG